MAYQNLIYDVTDKYDKYMADIAHAALEYCEKKGVPAMALAAVKNTDEKTYYKGNYIDPTSMGVRLYRNLFTPAEQVISPVSFPVTKKTRNHFELSGVYNGDEKKVFAYVDGKYEVSGIRCYAEKLTSLAYAYNIPFLFICALRNENGETDYGGTSMNPLAKGILLTDDVFMKITHLAAGYDPFGEQPADNL